MVNYDENFTFIITKTRSFIVINNIIQQWVLKQPEMYHSVVITMQDNNLNTTNLTSQYLTLIFSGHPTVRDYYHHQPEYESNQTKQVVRKLYNYLTIYQIRKLKFNPLAK